MKNWAADNILNPGTVKESADIILQSPVVIAVCIPEKQE